MVFKGAKKSLKKTQGKVSKKFKKSTRTAKKYTKVTAAVAGTAATYALGDEAFRGLLRTLTPAQSISFENFMTNTDSGLLVQTVALGSASALSASILKNAGVLNRSETTMAVAAGMGLAVGRGLTGLTTGGIGKRFQTLLDGEVGLTAFPSPGPTLNTPANANALNQVLTRNNNGGFSINSPYMDSVIATRPNSPYAN